MVAIKDMEMPSCCYECEYRPKNCSYCLRLHQAIPRDIFNTSRLPNCPLVEIEEHKLEKIEQIVNDKHYSVKALEYEIKEVLEQE